MRTTLRIDDDLLRDLRREAENEKTSLAAHINSVLRRAMSASRQSQVPREPYREKTFSMGSQIDLTKALALAGELEDEEALRKMELRK